MHENTETRMIPRGAALIVAVLTGWMVGSAPAQAQQPPNQIGNAFIRAVNNGDLASAQAYLAADVMALTPECFAFFGDGGCDGKAQFSAIVRESIAIHLLAKTTSVEVRGNSVRYEVEWRWDQLPALGIERVLGPMTLEVEGDLITRVVIEADPTDEQTAVYVAALAGAPGQQVTPPPTGDAGLR